MAIEFIIGKDVERLNDDELRAVLNALLTADATQRSVPLPDLDVSTRNSDPDAGIDARIKWPIGVAHDVFRGGENVLQYKSGKLTTKLLEEEFKKPGVQRALKNGGAYLFCAGHDYVSETARMRHEKTLRDLCRRKKIPVGRAGIVFGSTLARWICRYPAIVARPELRKQIREFITVQRWQTDNIQLSNPFRADEVRKDTMARIRAFLESSDPKDAQLRLEGPPGVGKTRLALEVVKDAEFANRTLYALNAENVEVQPFLMAVYSDVETVAIAVVDECSRTKQTVLAQYAQQSKGRLKLICVGVHDILYNTSPPTLSPLYQLERLPDADIEAIIRDSFRSAQKEFIDSTVRLSGGYVKLAMFVAATLDRWGASPPVELTKVMEIQEFLRKFVDKETRQALQALSVLAQIGWYEDLRVEAETVAAFIQLPMSALEVAVKKLRDQGVVIRKGRYLYVSPDLLAIQAAADLWSEKDYRLLDLINKLKDREPRVQLLVRLATMGEYAEMKEAVGRIVSKGGLYPTLSQLDEEFLSEVFRILSSAVPMAAADLLTELIVPASVDELSSFDTGRRNVMWALESLLRWPETSMKAARALMKLALCETEKISNNATSIFEQFFQVFLSGSPVPLMERLVLIDELLQSNTLPSRLLAARAAAGSLQSHETRLGGDTDYLSKRPYPPEWKPKTYGEIWEPRRKALAYLEQIAIGNDEAAVLARRERLFSTHALVSQGQVDDAISVLESATIKTDEDRRLMVSSSDQISRVPNLSDDQRSRVNRIRDSVFGSTYFERLRRWVGNRLPGDFDSHGESGFEAADQRVVKLAEEGFQTEIGEAEIAWLSSPEAQNVWLFGKRLGELDKVERFRDRIVIAAPNDVNCMLLASYLWGRGAEAGPDRRERLLDEIVDQKPIAAFGATWRGNPTVPGAERVIHLLSNGRVAGSELRVLMYGGWVEKLPTEYAIKIVNLMLTLDPEANTEAVLGIIDHAVHASAISVEQFGDILWLALENQTSQRSTMFDWHWGRVADLVVETDPGRLARIFVMLFESDETWLRTDAAQGALQNATRSDPAAVLGVIGPALLRDDLTAVRLRLKLEQWFGDLIPPEILVEWAQRHGRRGFLVAASLINSNTHRLPPVARLLVRQADNPKEVFNQLLANLGTGAFVGPMSSHLEGQLSTLKSWAQDEEPRIRSYAEAAIVYAEKSVKHQQLLEEEGTF